MKTGTDDGEQEQGQEGAPGMGVGRWEMTDRDAVAAVRFTLWDDAESKWVLLLECVSTLLFVIKRK